MARSARRAERGILWVLRTGAPWADLPRRYPPPQTCHRRFQKWVKEGVLHWENTVTWVEESRASAAAEFESIQPLLRAWDDALASLGGDPSRDDWDSFKPLRLSREEDWSDWLAYLLTGKDGCRVAAKLFSPASPASLVEQAVREAVVSDGERRADLVLLWSGGRASHVEVKIWDEDFAKTAETGLGCRRLFPDRRDWIDYVLLPHESEAAWRESAETNDIHVVTWTALCTEHATGTTADGWRTPPSPASSAART